MNKLRKCPNRFIERPKKEIIGHAFQLVRTVQHVAIQSRRVKTLQRVNLVNKIHKFETHLFGDRHFSVECKQSLENVHCCFLISQEFLARESLEKITSDSRAKNLEILRVAETTGVTALLARDAWNTFRKEQPLRRRNR